MPNFELFLLQSRLLRQELLVCSACRRGAVGKSYLQMGARRGDMSHGECHFGGEGSRHRFARPGLGSMRGCWQCRLFCRKQKLLLGAWKPLSERVLLRLAHQKLEGLQGKVRVCAVLSVFFLGLNHWKVGSSDWGKNYYSQCHAFTGTFGCLGWGGRKVRK